LGLTDLTLRIPKKSRI